jgi:hypothetical protein
LIEILSDEADLHERAGHRTRATNLAATAEKVVLATSQDGARKRNGFTAQILRGTRPAALEAVTSGKRCADLSDYFWTAELTDD